MEMYFGKTNSMPILDANDEHIFNALCIKLHPISLQLNTIYLICIT